MKLTTAAEFASGVALFVGVALSTLPEFTYRLGQIPDFIVDASLAVAFVSLSIDIMNRRKKRPQRRP
ncbi:hypothetical protein CA602_00890 [Paraburkholderia hospita]|nr:hypothetical protein CA602_00890 [Paraburkholderia hospita]